MTHQPFIHFRFGLPNTSAVKLHSQVTVEFGGSIVLLQEMHSCINRRMTTVCMHAKARVLNLF